MEGTFVPVFLEELLLALGFLLAQLVRAFQIFLKPLFLWHGASPLDFFAFLLTRDLFFLLLLDSCQLSQPPCLKFTFGIETISIVNVRDIVFLLFYQTKLFSISDTTSDGEDQLSANSRLIDSATSI